MDNTQISATAEFDVIVEAGQLERAYWRDVWQFRELFLFLAWKDVLVRYKQTAIGVAWSVIRPILTMVVFTVIFGRVAKLPSDGDTPYAIMVYSALLPWQMFAAAFSDAGNSMVSNSNMIRKVYFPRVMLPAASMVVSLVDFLISFGIFVILMAYYQFVPDIRILLLPLLLLLALAFALGIGLIVSSLNVKYRDFRFIIPFIVQFGLYVSPVGFSSSVVPDQWRLLYSLNPMVGVIDGFRWCILGDVVDFYLPGLAASIVLTISILVFGLAFFRKSERTFADTI